MRQPTDSAPSFPILSLSHRGLDAAMLFNDLAFLFLFPTVNHSSGPSGFPGAFSHAAAACGVARFLRLVGSCTCNRSGWMRHRWVFLIVDRFSVGAGDGTCSLARQPGTARRPDLFQVLKLPYQ